MTRLAPLLALAAMLAPPLCGASDAQTAAPPGTAAYPDNPSGTPATTTNGTAPAGPKAACPCPGDKPAAAAQADAAKPTGEAAQPGRVAIPTTAYPDSPVATPSTEPSGTAPK